MNILVALLVLGIIVIIHELGHFLLAKKNGITVTEFSVGMGPRIASFEKNGTRYSLKLFPIGGSCMMLGEDETVNDEGAFHKKGVWARFSVIFAGAFFNFIFAFVLALIVLGYTGVDIPLVNRVERYSPAEKEGLMQGDKIIRINNTNINFGREVSAYFYLNPITEKPVRVTYEREGIRNTISLTPELVNRYQLGFTYTPQNDTAEILEIAEGFPLSQAGLVPGDIIVAINELPVKTGKDLNAIFSENPLTNKSINITYERDGVRNTVTVTPRMVSSKYELGWVANLYKEKVSALETVKYSFYELKFYIVNTIQSLTRLITGRISVKEVSGPVGIVQFVDEIVTDANDYGIRVVLLQLASFSILLSANLGVINLLPLPALDGGRLVFLLIEAIRKKPVPKEKEALVHMIGMAALMIFMVFILYNDISKLCG